MQPREVPLPMQGDVRSHQLIGKRDHYLDILFQDLAPMIVLII